VLIHGSVSAAGVVFANSPIVGGCAPDGSPNKVTSGADLLPIPDFPDDALVAARVTNDNATGIVAPPGCYDPASKSLVMNLNSGTVTLSAPGTYYFSYLVISGHNSQLLLDPPDATGTVTIFLEGVPGSIVLCIANSTVVNSGMPPQLDVLVKSGDVFWDNAGDLHMAIFAPFSDFLSHNTVDFFGAIVCQNMNMDSVAFIVYDEALGERSSCEEGVSGTFWLFR